MTQNNNAEGNFKCSQTNFTLFNFFDLSSEKQSKILKTRSLSCGISKSVGEVIFGCSYINYDRFAVFTDAIRSLRIITMNLTDTVSFRLINSDCTRRVFLAILPLTRTRASGSHECIEKCCSAILEVLSTIGSS